MDPPALKILHLTGHPNEHALVRALLGEIVRVRYEVAWAQNADEGRQCLARGRYDACLVDSRVGSADGLEFIREMQAPGRGTGPMILLHDGDERLLDEDAMKAGAADYLVKGQIDGPLLERSIRYLIR